MIPDVHLRSPADHLITSSSLGQEQRFHIWLPVRLKTPPPLHPAVNHISQHIVMDAATFSRGQRSPGPHCKEEDR